MNYLAHLYLSGDDEELMIGNFIGDSVKGGMVDDLPAGIQKGVLLHRHIDSYTDQHPIVEESKKRLRPHFRKFAGVVADVFYDHYLAVEWKEYHSEPLAHYARNKYAQLAEQLHTFPLRSQQFYGYMVRYNALVNYSKIEGVDMVMQGMARRSRFESGMENSAAELKANYDAYQQEFREFFPELERSVKEFILS